ncbi:hypothetical protein SUGI_0294550 [Cryptomeria japonica]|uniref:extradiol ring-cleavage dioxygenase-like isoform X2 n=1 Tax=Cryptomeria japonica TaxID=3369 RepID=UPI002408CBF7|nr:extradiol ring-cleavage dioxygenase-like isoform X2 [Cryptomeria japonica]GLJ17023.1 hypothetical protein SUGI_0294550 [Cryptomeria japonica]
MSVGRLFTIKPCNRSLTLLQFGRKQQMQMAMMDTYFISHGSPTLAIEDIPARQFLLNWEKELPHKPKAILVISAHWDTSLPSVNIVPRNSTIHDFYGFPEEMYKLQYNAPGAPDLAKRVKELLINSGFKTIKEDPSRGLDHGAWVPLSLMYPTADIPVCQLSVQSRQNGEYHYRMGQALAPLKSDGVLIIGSGSATHNLRALDFRNPIQPAPWAEAFDSWLMEALVSGRHDEVNRFQEKAPNARMAHPYPDHFYPLNVALGAAGEGAKAELLHNSWSLGTLSYSSYAFRSTN